MSAEVTFVNPQAAQEFDCGICLSKLSKPVYIGCSSHIFCSDCIADLLHHNQPTTNHQFPCPTCRKLCDTQSINRLLIIDRRMDQLLVKCPNHEITEIKQQMMIKTERNSRRNSNTSDANRSRSRSRDRSSSSVNNASSNNSNECKNDSLCPWIGQWAKLKQHIGVCPEHPIKCRHCGLWMIRKEQTKHHRECRMYPISCHQCKQSGIARKNMSHHLNRECMLGKVRCFKLLFPLCNK